MIHPGPSFTSLLLPIQPGQPALPVRHLPHRERPHLREEPREDGVAAERGAAGGRPQEGRPEPHRGGRRPRLGVVQVGPVSRWRSVFRLIMVLYPLIYLIYRVTHPVDLDLGCSGSR